MREDFPKSLKGREYWRESESAEAEYDMFRPGLTLVAFLKDKSSERIAPRVTLFVNSEWRQSSECEGGNVSLDKAGLKVGSTGQESQCEFDETTLYFHVRVEGITYSARWEFWGCPHLTFMSASHPISDLDTTILEDWPRIFDDFCGKQLELLWRGSRDGFSAAAFHKQCDVHANTLTLILDRDWNVFGGFTPQA
jgi:hypothetical protein